MGQNPFASPYNAREAPAAGEATGSAPAAPAARVETRPLPPPPPRMSMSTVQQGTVGGGKGLSPYAPNSTTEVTGSLSSPALRSSPALAPWSRDGGITVTVKAGETIDALSRKYRVPAAAIRRANGLSTVSLLRVGQRLVIPRRVQPAVAQTTPPPGHAGAASEHIVAPGETLIKIAKHYHQPLVVLARINNIPPHTKLKLGDRLVIPGAPAQAPASPPPQAQLPAGKGKQVAEAEPQPSIRNITEGPDTSGPTHAGKIDPTGSLPGFRWPVRAKIVLPFGPMPDGQQNDGINLSVPEGTPIKAAEDGVVTYAGNAIKRFGNLVLVRHPNGYTTAYAHLSELLVTRNDMVKRGQVIARSGQTGGVKSPQLHFEVRKGSTPVDPVPFLDRGG
jgi:murein DD-endopeptidase MepM/ murein hydrolase activator NlpD